MSPLTFPDDCRLWQAAEGEQFPFFQKPRQPWPGALANGSINPLLMKKALSIPMIPSGLPGMNLSTRLTIAMVSLVLLTAAAVGYLSYRNLEATILPTELTRLDARAHLHATVLNSYVHSARSDVLMATAPASLDGLLRAYHGGGIDPTDGTPQTVWRDRFAKYLVTQLAVKPEYVQSRLIGITDGGREIIRADRSGPEGAVRLVPDSELRKKGDRDYFKETIRLPAGKVYISPIELNQEHGVIETPHVPVMWVATPVFGVDGKLFGIIAINIDMRPALTQLRQSAPVAGRIYAVNENGNYLINPDASRCRGSGALATSGRRFAAP